MSEGLCSLEACQQPTPPSMSKKLDEIILPYLAVEIWKSSRDCNVFFISNNSSKSSGSTWQ